MTPRNPSLEELAIWEVLTTAAEAHADAVIALAPTERLPNADRLIAARKAARLVVLPAGQAISGSPMVRLLRLVDRWAVMSAGDRRNHARELRHTAIEAATMAGFKGDGNDA